MAYPAVSDLRPGGELGSRAACEAIMLSDGDPANTAACIYTPAERTYLDGLMSTYSSGSLSRGRRGHSAVPASVVSPCSEALDARRWGEVG